ncbi:MAG: hypothetical protein SF172_11340 [Burkholderiales bacterium]|nr:hypothetical protein [Burkholderiales bacterium]
MAGDTVSCQEHGAARATFVCTHLARKPGQRWFSFKPDKRHPFPDAWCHRCDALYERQGGWPDEGETPPISVICHHCYIAGRDKSAHSLTGRALDNWASFVGAAIFELKAKQSKLSREYDLSRHERFDWDQSTGKLVFSNAGKPAVIADFEFIGSTAKASGTWLWSWANTSHLPRMRKAATTVLELGELLDFRKLTTPLWRGDDIDGWEMAATAAHLLDAPGVYRSPSDRGASYLLIKRIRAA